MSFLRKPFLGMLVTALWAVPAQPVVPVWDPNGVSLCGPDGCQPGAPRLLPDGAGGVYVAWTDERNSTSTGTDIYLQRLTGEGVPAPGWPAEGLPVCRALRIQQRISMTHDGNGGILIAWEDERNASTNQLDIYAQRVLPQGEIAPGWIPDGVPVCLNVDYQYYPEICTDGAGGAFVAWRDFRDYLELESEFPVGIYVQHLLADGAPSADWPIDGQRLMPHESSGQQLLPDGTGGVIIAWGDGRRGISSSDLIDLYATRIQPNGQTYPRWPVDGLLLASSRTIGGTLVLASESEFYVPVRQATGPGFGDANYYVQKATFDGAIAADWPPEGILFCCSNSTSRQALEVDGDGLGGLLAAWVEDDRFAGSDIFALRLLPTGETAPGWAQDGVVVSDPTIPNDYEHDLAPDGNGGAYIAWVRFRPFAEYNTTYVQHLSATGQPHTGWPLYGYALSLPRNTDNPAAISNDSGSVIVAWTERSGLTGSGLFGQRLLDDDYVSTRPMVMSAEASEAGIRVTWFAKDARLLESTVYRRTESSSWTYEGAPEVTGPDELRYDDADVTPGERYAYRLGYFDGATESFTEEIWVEAAAPLAFALDGFRPNPAVGLPIVSLTLVKSEPARLEVFDLRGRLVLRRDLSGLGAGRHTVSLDGVRLSPGVYVLRLTQGDQVVRVRGVVLK